MGNANVGNDPLGLGERSCICRAERGELIPSDGQGDQQREGAGEKSFFLPPDSEFAEEHSGNEESTGQQISGMHDVHRRGEAARQNGSAGGIRRQSGDE